MYKFISKKRKKKVQPHQFIPPPWCLPPHPFAHFISRNDSIHYLLSGFRFCNKINSALAA